MKHKTVLHSTISVGSHHEFIREIFYLVQYKIPSYVCFANVHMVMEGYKDNAFQKVMNSANLLAPDGRPISLFIKYFDKIDQPRICGMDLFPDLLKHAEASGKSVYFLGNTNEILDTIVHKAKIEFPALRIRGSYSPPFRSLLEEEKNAMLDSIKKLAPDLVFVSLGCPKQEKWMAENKDKLGSCLIGVGQAFNTYAGVEKRLPLWMRNLSLEWMYRLYSEPKRLWKRYLFTNSYFILLTLNHMAKRVSQNMLAPFHNTNQEVTERNKS
jgi:N-acetylglucosaminyldiphosphoundecaprenol N-acetyl-beta-D-mannosaminyltransferase